VPTIGVEVLLAPAHASSRRQPTLLLASHLWP
jgi:hypothetical protein